MLPSINAANAWLMGGIVDAVSTPWAFWVCNFLILGTLVIKRPEDLYAWALFISSIWYQAVMLPVITNSDKIQMDRLMNMVAEELGMHREEMALQRAEIQKVTQLCRQFGVE